jgi:predicted house-cleaning noncanonical NTP pyrophosphatase (MazG superfamily)
MRLDYHKLVRDEIPRIIEAGGGQPVTRVLDQAGYLAALRAKLMEEAGEAQAAPDGQLRSELADVLEVLRALAAAHGMSWADVAAEAPASGKSAGASTSGSFSNTSNRWAEYRAGADQILNGLNHGPFGEKNFFIPNGHWAYGPSRAMWCRLPRRGRAYGPGSPRRKCAGSVGVRGAGAGMLDVGSTGR